MDTTSQTYQLDPQALAPQRRRGLRRTLPIYLGGGAIALAAANRGDFSEAGIIGLIVGGAVALLIATLLIWAGLRSLSAQWASYELTLGEDSVARHVARLPDLSIRRDQVTAIEEYPGTGLAIRTADRRAHIVIPCGLLGYDQVRAELASWMPIVAKQGQSALLLRCLGAAALPLLGIVALSLAQSTLVVAALGAILVVGALWLAISIQRSALYQRWFKLLMWCAIPMVLVAIAQRLQAVG